MADKLNIGPLEKALHSLERALKVKTVYDIVRDATISVLSIPLNYAGNL